LQHPYLFPVIRSEFIKDKGTALVLRPFAGKGSLKDLIYDKVDFSLPCEGRDSDSLTPRKTNNFLAT